MEFGKTKSEIEDIIDKIKELVFDRKYEVTARAVSSEFDIHIKDAQGLLTKFVKQNNSLDDELQVKFLVGGFKSQGGDERYRQIVVVPKKELKETKESFDEVNADVIYSIRTPLATHFYCPKVVTLTSNEEIEAKQKLSYISNPGVFIKIRKRPVPKRERKPPVDKTKDRLKQQQEKAPNGSDNKSSKSNNKSRNCCQKNSRKTKQGKMTSMFSKAKKEPEEDVVVQYDDEDEKDPFKSESEKEESEEEKKPVKRSSPRKEIKKEIKKEVKKESSKSTRKRQPASSDEEMVVKSKKKKASSDEEEVVVKKKKEKPKQKYKRLQIASDSESEEEEKPSSDEEEPVKKMKSVKKEPLTQTKTVFEESHVDEDGFLVTEKVRKTVPLETNKSTDVQNGKSNKQPEKNVKVEKKEKKETVEKEKDEKEKNEPKKPKQKLYPYQITTKSQRSITDFFSKK